MNGWTSGFTADPPLITAIGPTDDLESLRRGVLCHVLGLDPERPAKELEEELEYERDRGRISAALEGVLSAVDTARTVLIEHAYFDLDGRSEEAWSLARQYRFAAVAPDRLHFFSVPIGVDDFNLAISAPSTAAALLQDNYLGYCVLRVDNPSHVVGRTLVRPPMHDERLNVPAELVGRVRTRVREHLTLAGIPLQVEGVPFMQQDGAVTRCAHAAAWMAHYTAVLRGVTPRVPVAALHSPGQQGAAQGLRQYPSPGLTDVQLEQALANGGLPPEIRLISALEVLDKDLWYHRPELTVSGTHWHTEGFSSTVCRYLNSGMPVLLARGDHVEVITGYLRGNDLVGSTAGTSVVAFLLADDRRGPYLIEAVDELLWQSQPGDLLVVPAPPGLALGGEAAERLGSDFFESVIEQVLTDDDSTLPLKASVTHALLLLKSKKLAVRSYAVESNEFKRSFAARCGDQTAVGVMNSARLPKYVWVIEMIDRQRRGPAGGGDPVLGEVVLDGTAVSIDGAEALVVHVGRYITVFDVASEEEQAFICEDVTYESGRWGHTPHTIGGVEFDPRVAKSSGAYSLF